MINNEYVDEFVNFTTDFRDNINKVYPTLGRREELFITSGYLKENSININFNSGIVPANAIPKSMNLIVKAISFTCLNNNTESQIPFVISITDKQVPFYEPNVSKLDRITLINDPINNIDTLVNRKYSDFSSIKAFQFDEISVPLTFAQTTKITYLGLSSLTSESLFKDKLTYLTAKVDNDTLNWYLLLSQNSPRQFSNVSNIYFPDIPADLMDPNLIIVGKTYNPILRMFSSSSNEYVLLVNKMMLNDDTPITQDIVVVNDDKTTCQLDTPVGTLDVENNIEFYNQEEIPYGESAFCRRIVDILSYGSLIYVFVLSCQVSVDSEVANLVKNLEMYVYNYKPYVNHNKLIKISSIIDYESVLLTGDFVVWSKDVPANEPLTQYPTLDDIQIVSSNYINSIIVNLIFFYNEDDDDPITGEIEFDSQWEIIKMAIISGSNNKRTVKIDITEEMNLYIKENNCLYDTVTLNGVISSGNVRDINDFETNMFISYRLDDGSDDIILDFLRYYQPEPFKPYIVESVDRLKVTNGENKNKDYYLIASGEFKVDRTQNNLYFCYEGALYIFNTSIQKLIKYSPTNIYQTPIQFSIVNFRGNYLSLIHDVCGSKYVVDTIYKNRTDEIRFRDVVSTDNQIVKLSKYYYTDEVILVDTINQEFNIEFKLPNNAPVSDLLITDCSFDFIVRWSKEDAKINEMRPIDPVSKTLGLVGEDFSVDDFLNIYQNREF